MSRAAAQGATATARPSRARPAVPAGKDDQFRVDDASLRRAMPAGAGVSTVRPRSFIPFRGGHAAEHDRQVPSLVVQADATRPGVRQPIPIRRLPEVARSFVLSDKAGSSTKGIRAEPGGAAKVGGPPIRHSHSRPRHQPHPAKHSADRLKSVVAHVPLHSCHAPAPAKMSGVVTVGSLVARPPSLSVETTDSEGRIASCSRISRKVIT